MDIAFTWMWETMNWLNLPPCIPSQHILLQVMHLAPCSHLLLPDPPHIAIEITDSAKNTRLIAKITLQWLTHIHSHGKTYVRLSVSFASYRDLKDTWACAPNPTRVLSRPLTDLKPSDILRLAMAATIGGNSLA